MRTNAFIYSRYKCINIKKAVKIAQLRVSNRISAFSRSNTIHSMLQTMSSLNVLNVLNS